MASKRKTITVNEAVNLIKASNGSFFTVAFTKRSDNQLRRMNCRTGVSKGVKGNGGHRNRSGLVTVYDMTKKEYRNINTSGLRTLSIKGKEYTVA